MTLRSSQPTTAGDIRGLHRSVELTPFRFFVSDVHKVAYSIIIESCLDIVLSLVLFYGVKYVSIPRAPLRFPNSNRRASASHRSRSVLRGGCTAYDDDSGSERAPFSCSTERKVFLKSREAEFTQSALQLKSRRESHLRNQETRTMFSERGSRRAFCE